MDLKTTLKEKGLLTPSIVPMPEGAEWLWQLYIDGEPVDMAKVHHVALKSKFGVMNFGADIQTHRNSFAFEEVSHGGSIIIPFVCLNDRQIVTPPSHFNQVLVGVIEQCRPKQGGVVLNCPRGFVGDSQAEDHEGGARRELNEETGMSGQLILLPGHPLNPNSALFETGPDDGCRVYGLCLGPNQVAVNNDGSVHVATDKLSHDAGEIIGKCRFIPATEASELGDMFTVAGVCRLLNFLIKKC